MLKRVTFSLVKAIDRAVAHVPPRGGFQPLRGSFSAYGRLNRGIYEGSVLYREQPKGPCAEDSMTRRSGLSQHDFQPWPAFWTCRDDARLVGAMWHWRDPDNLLCEEGVFGLTQRRRLGEDRLSAQWFPGKPERLAGAWTSIASNWGDGRNYFHWLCDSMTRLLVRESLPEPTRILVPRDLPGYALETLDMLGLSEKIDCPPTRCVRPDRYYFCSPTAMTGVWNPAGFDWLREKFIPWFHPPDESKRVFLTRRGTNRIPRGLEELERSFGDAGFEIVDPGRMIVREQVGLISGAAAVAGIHGAAMSNLLWARPGTPILEIFESRYLNGCYEQIALQGGLAYRSAVADQASGREVVRSWIADLKREFP